MAVYNYRDFLRGFRDLRDRDVGAEIARENQSALYDLFAKSRALGAQRRIQRAEDESMAMLMEGDKQFADSMGRGLGDAAGSAMATLRTGAAANDMSVEDWLASMFRSSNA